MTLTLKEQKQIKEKLESMGIEIANEPNYSCMAAADYMD